MERHVENSDRGHEILASISALMEELRTHLSDNEKQEPVGSKHCPRKLALYLCELHKVRRRVFGDEMCDNSRWIMILELFKSESDKRKVYVSSLCAETGRSQTAALRRLGELETAGLIVRNPDPDDRRCMLVHLTDQARYAMVTVCEQMSSPTMGIGNLDDR